MAGPFENKTGINVDEIINSGLDATGVGAPVDTATTGAPPSVPSVQNPMDPGGTGGQGPGQLRVGVNGPEWAWAPSQQDFGQVDVRRGNYAGGQVPTVNAQMPFAALANRQQAIAKRKDALAAKVAAYDPYGNMGKAHDRYQVAFNNYATKYIDDQRKGLADQMFGGDVAQADKYLATDPQGQSMLRRWGHATEALGQENKTWVDATIKALADNAEGKYIPPSRLNQLMEYASAVGPDGMPVQGTDAEEFLAKQRNVETQLREMEYVDKAIAPAMDQALKSMTGFTIAEKRDKRTNKLMLTTTESKSFDDALRHAVNNTPDFVDTYYNGDKDAAFQGLKELYPTSIKETVSFETYGYPPGATGSGADKAKIQESAYNVSYSQIPPDIFSNRTKKVPMLDSKGKPYMNPDGTPRMKDQPFEKGISEAAAAEYPTMNLFDIVSGQGRTPVARQFKGITKQGNTGAPEWMIPTDIVNMAGQLFIIGKKSGAPRTSSSGEAEDSPWDTQSFSQLETTAVPYNGNEKIIEQSFPWLEDAKIKQALGYTGERKWNAKQSAKSVTGGAKKPDVTEAEYNNLKPGDKYWYKGEQLTKE